MLKDSYDKIICSMLVVTLVALGVMLSDLGTGDSSGKADAARDKALEQAIAYQARVDFLRKLYEPVENMIRTADYQSALFKLDELAVQYPGEAHGNILKGEVLYSLGAIEESVASLVAGVKLNGDYVDRKSPLSRRQLIARVAEDGLRIIGTKARSNPGNSSIETSLRNVNYLRSRLAGGCE